MANIRTRDPDLRPGSGGNGKGEAATMGSWFRTTLRVRLSETDALGVVYYGQYFTYFDLARLEMLRSAGITLASLKRKGLAFVAAEVSCRYLASARFDEELKLSVAVSKIGRTSVEYSHRIAHGKREVAEGRVTDVLVGQDGKPAKLTEDLKRRLAKYRSD